MKTNITCYRNLYGLSCVENNVLMFLREKGENVSYLYGDSEIGLKELFQRFIRDGEKYEYFSGFPRIQDRLKDRGILQIEMEDGLKWENSENTLVLAKVKTDELNKLRVGTQLPWRDDHYMYLEDAGDITLYNDSPYYELTVSREMFKTIYDNKYLEIKRMKEILPEDKIFFKEEHKRAKIPASWEELYDMDSIEHIPDIYVKIRDLIGVYKVSRYRRKEFEGIFADTDYMLPALREADRLFTFAAYMCLKNTARRDDVLNLVRCLWEIEGKIS